MSFPISVLEPSTVTAKCYTLTYGDDNPVFGYDITGGVLDGTPEITCEAFLSKKFGDFNVYAYP